MMRHNIIITMAGRGSRFYEAGYTVPKYEIIAHGHSLFYWSMLSLRNFITDNTRLIFVCLAANASENFVRSQCALLGIGDVHVLELADVTDGQATTAYLSRDLWMSDASLTIYNIDTFVNARSLTPAAIPADADGWIPCFPGQGDHWSFVNVGSDEWATEIAEKRRISEHASVGLYWFSKAGDFSQAYEAFFADPANLVKGERYVAPLYQYLVKAGKKVGICELPVSDVHVLGTPAELKIFESKSRLEIV